ncbi:MAG: FecR domain-containing protein, partial [Rhodospirillales bacterium]|nr:FecR domain-containing protein [Rhodospirillales bacterium]
MTAADAQQQQAGVAAAVRGRVEVAMTAGAVGREVKSGEAIYLGNAVKSGPDSGMQILLLDQTTFTIGPNSEITIDQFVFDPASGSGKVAASVAKGVFRFVTGKVAQQNPSDMTIRLPTGNIGIRGTIAVGSVEPSTNGQPLKQEVVLLGPGSGREGSSRIGAIVLTGGAGSTGVTINQPGFGSQFGQGSWGTPVRYTPDMINALQQRIDTPITGKGPGAAAQQGAPPGGKPGGPGPGAFGPGGPLGRLGPQSQRLIADGSQPPCQQTSASSCANLNPPPSMTGIADGTATFDQLRAISGTFFYAQNNVPLSGGGSYNFALNLDAGNKTVGGGNSAVSINGLNVNGTLALTTQSYSASSGNAVIAYNNLPGLTGVLCSPSCSTTVTGTFKNSGGVTGANLAHTVFVNGGGPS